MNEEPTDEQLTRAAQWQMMLAQAGRHAEKPITTKPKLYEGRGVKQRGGNQKATASADHPLRQYQI